MSNNNINDIYTNILSNLEKKDYEQFLMYSLSGLFNKDDKHKGNICSLLAIYYTDIEKNYYQGITYGLIAIESGNESIYRKVGLCYDMLNDKENAKKYTRIADGLDLLNNQKS